MASSATAPPALLEATRNSTIAWQDDLQALFDNAKERFPDVVWELSDDDAAHGSGVEEVWGHKAIVYARAPPGFQQRYFKFRPPPVNSPHPYSSSPTGTIPAQSSLSLTLGLEYGALSRSPSPFRRAASPSPSTNLGGILRLSASANPTLFANELEYLYTGKGLGEAFEFLFDSPEQREEGDAEEARVDKLRKDLVFMWRSRLYSDVRIALTGNFSSSNHENATAIFSSHRFILVTRSPYFRTQLLQWGVKQTPGEPLTLSLPAPPFTPASLHFTLGYIYTGTLVFSHRTFDLDTAFHIMRSATYLSLDHLYDEVQARLVQEMMHGLFHAFLEFSEYERITGGKWGTGGCRCRQCARRAPRVLEFALLDDVKNSHLERGARRALVGLFGEGWCNPEFARLPQKTRQSLLTGLAKRTTPMNVFPLLFASHAALGKLNGVIEPWADMSRDMITTARKTIDDVLCTQAEECFEQPEWLAIMEGDGARFEDGEQVEWAMDAFKRGLNEKNAASAYQILVSSILLRPHLTETSQTMLSPTSHIRVQVEQTRLDVLRWLKKRWMGVKQECGFDGLDSWAIKEISHEIEVPVEDLYGPPVATTPKSTPRAGSGLKVTKADDDGVSVRSLRTEALSRGAARAGGEAVRSSAASMRSIARSTQSTVSRTTIMSRKTIGTGVRPDSKLAPTQPGRSISASTRSTLTDETSSQSLGSNSASTPRKHGLPTSLDDRSSKIRSSTTSVKSVRSHTSTVRRNVAGPSTLRPPFDLSRPGSTLSSTSDGSTTFETAKSDVTPSSGPRSRVTSTASTLSTASTKSAGTVSSPKVARSRVTSTASGTSVSGRRAPPSPIENRTTLSPMIARRTPSTTSVRTTTSSTSTSAPGKRNIVRKSGVPPTPPPKNKILSHKTSTPTVIGQNPGATSHEKQSSVTSSGSASTVKGSLKRKNSSDTVRGLSGQDALRSSADIPRGATLDIGIPCIISYKRARFRAYARYIGEVEGEMGPWVGVEVPINDNWSEDKVEGQQWHDGTWGGIRYFDIGAASDWEYGEERGTRRRRVDWTTHSLGIQSSVKREGDQLTLDRAKRLRSVSPAVSDMSNSESRGLFVRPQQVLYVVDAVA